MAEQERPNAEVLSDSRARRSKKDRRALGVGFAVSAAFHLAFVFLYAVSSAPLNWMVGSFPVVEQESRASGIELVQIVEVASEDLADPDTPVQIQDAEVNEAPAIEAPDLGDAPEAPLPNRPRSSAERLRAGQGDVRLWQGIDPELTELTEEQGARLRLLSAIESANDSAAAVAEAQAAMLDWTHTDDEGNRWGVTPGKLHLGKLEIPLPFGFSAPPDYDGSRAQRGFEFNDIDQAAGRRAAQQTWKDRQKVMEERRKAERARRIAEEQARVNERRTTPPDTTGVRRR